MTEKEILLIMTICALLDKRTNPTAVQIQYDDAKRVMANFATGGSAPLKISPKH
jgi:hypothetical protein